MSKARDIARAGTALTNVDATELGYLDGVTSNVQTQITSVQTTANGAVPKSTVTAKGDLIAATASGTVSNLPVSSDGSILVANSAASTGLSYSAQAGANLLANGSFDIWQRGTSAFTANTVYTTDRWFVYSSSSYSLTQETSVIPDGATNAVKMTATAGSSYCNLQYAMEQSEVEKLAGKTVTFSVYLRANATYNGSFNLIINSSTTGNSQSASWGQLASTNHIPSTSAYTRVSVTATIPTTAKGLAFLIGQNSVLASGSIYYAALAKAEIGSVSTVWSRCGTTIQGELAACQRYYWRANAFAETSYPILGFGAGNSATQARTIMPFPVQMRIKPTAIDYSTVTNFAVFRMDDVQSGVTAVTIDTNLSTSYSGWLSWTTTGLTANTPYYVRGNNNSSYYLGFSAEL